MDILLASDDPCRVEAAGQTLPGLEVEGCLLQSEADPSGELILQGLGVTQ